MIGSLEHVSLDFLLSTTTKRSSKVSDSHRQGKQKQAWGGHFPASPCKASLGSIPCSKRHGVHWAKSHTRARPRQIYLRSLRAARRSHLALRRHERGDAQQWHSMASHHSIDDGLNLSDVDRFPQHRGPNLSTNLGETPPVPPTSANPPQTSTRISSPEFPESISATQDDPEREPTDVVIPNREKDRTV
ncbi:uncharacterized protein BJX67DRAFT_353476, partial [Aspergillus lucknowensis]